jgi:hypothetical protein
VKVYGEDPGSIETELIRLCCFFFNQVGRVEAV